MSSNNNSSYVKAKIGKYAIVAGCLIFLGAVIFGPLLFLLLGNPGIIIAGACLLTGTALALFGNALCFSALVKGFTIFRKGIINLFTGSNSSHADPHLSNKKRNAKIRKTGQGNWNIIGEDESQPATTPTFVASTTKNLVLFSYPKLFTLRLSSLLFWKSKNSYTQLADNEEVQQVRNTFHP